MASIMLHVVCALLCVIGLAESRMYGNFRRPPYLMRHNDDKGIVKNCAKSGHNFTLMWEPRDIQAGMTVKFYLDFTPEVDFDSGTMVITAWVDYIPDPIIQQTLDGDCKKVTSFMPVTCPIKKNVRIRYWGIPVLVPAEVPIPPNNYKVRVEIKNSKNKLFFCGEAKTAFRDTFYYQKKFSKFLKKK